MKTCAFCCLALLTVSASAQVEPLPRAENLSTFDPFSLRLERFGDRWRILAGQEVLKDCGRREEDARIALHLLNQLRVDRHATVGTSQPIMEYWLCGAEPPRFLPRGVRVLPINTADVRLELSQGCWVLRESSRVLLNFGGEEVEAKQALGVIRKYGFNRVGIVGQAVPVLMVFIAHPDGSGSRTLPHRREPPKQSTKTETPTPGKPAQPPSFYPTPIVPPIRSALEKKQPTMMTDRGRPSMTAMKPDDQSVPAVAALGSSARHVFACTQAQVRLQAGEWVLVVGTEVLARFGSSERHARVAQTALQHYRLSEIHSVGASGTARYFLSSGQAPRGLMTGLMGERFQSDLIAVRPHGDRFFVAQGSRLLLDCGPDREGAEQMIQAIRRYGFDHICRIGPNDGQCLVLLVKSY